MRARTLLLTLGVMLACGVSAAQADEHFARDPGQAIDADYTAKIAQYTTQPRFNTVLTDYLPASASVPTPARVLGDVAGAPDFLPYTADVHRYFRMLAAATPRVRVLQQSTGLRIGPNGRTSPTAIAIHVNVARETDHDGRSPTVENQSAVGSQDFKADAKDDGAVGIVL